MSPIGFSYGVVGVLRNGPGPTVMVRTELDALPVEERTGLPYASHVKAKQPRWRSWRYACLRTRSAHDWRGSVRRACCQS